jgi:hypothetical protein
MAKVSWSQSGPISIDPTAEKIHIKYILRLLVSGFRTPMAINVYLVLIYPPIIDRSYIELLPFALVFGFICIFIHQPLYHDFFKDIACELEACHL